jgi:hypothetical protein
MMGNASTISIKAPSLFCREAPEMNTHTGPACQRHFATLPVPRRDANSEASNVPPRGKPPRDCQSRCDARMA